ncbi:MAG: PTS sugar transporter subunit IIC [Deltaproteobacteria bacterium]|nr:PTS sugar transporter subunit IIC [Deltaproteobacteria bacterium]
MIVNVLIVSIVGGILCLDRVFVQVLVSRPIVAAPLVGWILGDPYTGLTAGAFIELLWIDRLPIGAYIPPNDTIVAVLTAAGAIESGRILGHLPPELIVASVLLFVPMALLEKKMEVRICIRANEKLAQNAWSAAARGDIRAISRNHLRAAFRSWLLPAAVILITLPFGVGAMTWLYPRLDPWMVRGLNLMYGVLPMVGAAAAFNTVHLRGALPILCAAFLITTAILRYVRY